tara:strand:+ start:11424 stop:11801 length:378 start_codon:yes stop_codon:yes gene_type:complete
MAYAKTVTRTKVSDSNVDFVYDITETDSTSGGDEFTIDLTVTTGRILRYKVFASAGTVDPVVGVVTSASNNDIVLENGTAAISIDLEPSPVTFYSSGKTLFINNKASTGGLTIKTRIFIRETWGL